MKRYHFRTISVAMCLIPLLIVCACAGEEIKKTDTPKDEKLELSESQISIGPDGGSLNMSGSASSDWLASSDVSWLTVVPEHGQSGSFVINISVFPNYDISERSGNIRVKSGKLEKTVGISQMGVTPSPESKLEVDIDDNLELSRELQDIQVSLTSSSDWIAEVDAAWLAVSPSTGLAEDSDFFLVISENRGMYAREATLTVRNKDAKSRTAHIHQLGIGETIITTGKTEFSSDGGIFELYVNTNDEYVHEIPADCKWITMVGINDFTGKMYFTVAANESAKDRSAILKVGTIYKTIDVEVSQAGVPDTEVYISRTDFPSGGGTFEVKVNTTDELKYEIPSDCSWLSLGAMEAKSASMTFNVAPNTSGPSRSVSIKVGTIFKVVDVTINQNGVPGSGGIDDMPVIPLSR